MCCSCQSAATSKILNHHHHQNAWVAKAVVPISFVGNVHVRLQGPVLVGWRLWSHHQSGTAKSALDVRVVFSSLASIGTLEGISSRDTAI